MQKYQRPTFNIKELGINPCTLSLVIPVNELIYNDRYKREDDMLLPATQEVEATPFAKLYVTAERRKLVASLSASAKELYLWIMYEVDASEDALWINKTRFMEENSTSLNTYKKAVEELIRYAFIAYTVVKDVYWINPDFFFRGDRIKKYPKCVRPR